MNSPLSFLSRAAWRPSNRILRTTHFPSSQSPLNICARCRLKGQVRFNSGRQLADDPNWISAIDQPPKLVRVGRKHGPGIIILGMETPGFLHQRGSGFHSITFPSWRTIKRSTSFFHADYLRLYSCLAWCSSKI